MPVTSTLYDSPAEIVGKLLIDIGMGTDPTASLAWPVYVTDAPDLPDDCITVYDTTGSKGSSGRTNPDGEIQGYNGFQIAVRGKDHVTGWRKADAIFTALSLTDVVTPVKFINVTIDGRTYLVYCIVRCGNVIPLGKETPTSRRRIFTINAYLCT